MNSETEVRSIICIKCGEAIPVNRMIMHIHLVHNRFNSITKPDVYTLCKYLGYPIPPKCCHPGCRNSAEFDKEDFRFKATCFEHRLRAENKTPLSEPPFLKHKWCPICKTWVGPYMEIHRWKCHPNLSPAEYLRIFKGLDEIPKCPNCSKEVPLKDKEYDFQDFCSRKCRSEYNFKLRSKIGRNSNAFGSTLVEVAVYERFQRLFPNEVINLNRGINGISVGIVFESRKLIIECDREYYNRYKSDIERDKKLYAFGYKVRRLNEEYLKNIPTDNELRYLIEIESKLEKPYYERIPVEDILKWKINLIQIGIMKLITYEG